MGKVAKNLKVLREERLMTQEELSELCGISVKTISKAEGGWGIALSSIKTLAKKLKVKPEDLVGI